MVVNERCFGFHDVVKLRPKFASLYRSDLLSLFQVVSGGEFMGALAFRIIECVRILNLSKQVIHPRINENKVKQHLLRRKYRDFDEKLILASDLKKIKDEPINIKERILELFMEKL